MKFHKFIKNVTDSNCAEFDKLDAAGLKNQVTVSTQVIAKMQSDLDANGAYEQAKSDKADFESGLKAAKKYDGAKIAYCLLRLKELDGNLTEGEQEALDSHRAKVKARLAEKKDVATKTKPDLSTVAGRAAQLLADAAQPGVTVSLNGKAVPKSGVA